MKSMKSLTCFSFQIRGLLVAAALFGASVAALHAGQPTPIYSGAPGGWNTQAWGGITATPETQATKGKNAGVIAVKLSADAKPYSGMSFVSCPSAAIPLTDELRTKGFVIVTIKLGTDAAGKPGAFQDVQFCLGFITAEGKPAYAPFTNMTTLKPEGSDASGFHTVKISIAPALAAVAKGNPASITSLSGLKIQFVDQPQAGFYVSEAVVKASE